MDISRRPIDTDRTPAASFGPAGALLPAARPPRRRMARVAVHLLVLSLLWSLLTDWRPEAWVFGAPAVLLGALLGFALPPAPRWRIAPLAALRFMVWFAVQAVRGAVDVSLRAVAPRVTLDPGFRSWRTALPEGAPRVVLANAVSLLPGTLSAELDGERLVVHLLDCRSDLEGDMAALETRVAALFALPRERTVTA